MNTKQAEVEELKKDEDVRRALDEASVSKPQKKAKVEPRQKLFLGTYLIVLFSAIAFYYLVTFGYLDLAGERFVPVLERVALGTAASTLVLWIWARFPR